MSWPNLAPLSCPAVLAGLFLFCYDSTMQESFYFYDLETSGLNSRTDRIMQFAGQRTDLEFNPIGDPVNLLVQLPEDTLPSPGAIMVTGITPQSTKQDGLTEREFCEFVINDMATPGTTIMGYNSVRFDDEFMRHTLWRNFYDPYEWQWKDRRSRWDLLDVVRLTRALRPEGIEWPVTDDGRSTNRLELITKLNGISHEHAHDALADVVALIEVSKLIKTKQPQLFDFLYSIRDKRGVQKVVNLNNPQPFVYASGRYPSAYEKTTVAFPVAAAKNGNILVFDLRYDVEELLAAEQDGTYIEKFGSHWQKEELKKDPKKKFRIEFFPMVKTLQYNHCPAVAPLGVLEKEDGWQKISLTRAKIDENLAHLKNHPEFIERVAERISQRPAFPPAVDPESALYNGFLDDHDRLLCSAVRSNGAEDLADFHPNFADERLPELLLHYKAKNYPEALDQDEAAKWEAYRIERLKGQAPKFLEEIGRIQQDLAHDKVFNGRKLEDSAYFVEELLLWYQSLQPDDY